MGLLSAVIRHKRLSVASYFLTLFSTVLSLIAAIANTDSLQPYTFGSWPRTVGIEYAIDKSSNLLIIYINALMLIMLISTREGVRQELHHTITAPYRYLYYTLLLIAHAGFSGVLATNDFFHLYVCIEISQLASYGLIALSRNNKSLVAALDYLIFGSIGAIFILLSIGIVLALTGSLNLYHIHEASKYIAKSTAMDLASGLFVVGCLLKIAVFPVNIWLTRIYNSASNSLLTYFSAVSSAISIYTLVKGMQLVFNYQLATFKPLIVTAALLSVYAGAFRALNAKFFREFIAYSALSQTGYILLLAVFVDTASEALYWYVIADGLTKAGMYMINSQLEENKGKAIVMEELCILRHNRFLLMPLGVLSLSSIGLPITLGFVNKVNLMNLLISQGSYKLLASIALASVLVLIYNCRVWQCIYADPYEDTNKNSIKPSASLLFGIVAVAASLLILAFFA